jgi:hypothetical protein
MYKEKRVKNAWQNDTTIHTLSHYLPMAGEGVFERVPCFFYTEFLLLLDIL